MHFSWSTLLLQTVNFAVLVWLLRRFLYKPVLRMVDARRAEIDKQYADAKAVEAEAAAHLSDIEAKRAGIAAEREQVLKAAAAQAEEAAKARRDRSEREAATLLDDARKTLAAEREQALAEARRSALDLGAEVARRLLAEMPMALRAEGWLERMEQYLTAMPRQELGRLLGQLTDSAPLRVATASAFPPETAESWRRRSQALLRRPSQHRLRGQSGPCCRRGAPSAHGDPQLLATQRACRHSRRDRGRW